ncbi:MAG: hypothetical protein NXI31_05850 [bacterium]|nr:hypothetical protein [bacterium]
MKMLMLLGVAVGGVLGASGVAWSAQDPAPAERPAEKPTQEPAEKQEPGQKDPGTSSVKRLPRDPIEGVYRLLSRMIDGVPDPNAVRGYVAVTRRHMLLCLAARGPDPDYPLLRAGVREWQRRKRSFDTIVQMGFYTDADGEVHVEEPGTSQVRRIDVIRGKLRIWQEGNSYLEFERIE